MFVYLIFSWILFPDSENGFSEATDHLMADLKVVLAATHSSTSSVLYSL
jgi:hypothetical protein